MVCLLTPCSRATSSVVRPASTCFSAAIICASVCRLLLIRFSPFLRPNRIPKWTDSGGQVRSGAGLIFPSQEHPSVERLFPCSCLIVLLHRDIIWIHCKSTPSDP